MIGSVCQVNSEHTFLGAGKYPQLQVCFDDKSINMRGCWMIVELECEGGLK